MLARSGEGLDSIRCSLPGGGCECPDPFSSRPAISEKVIAAYRQQCFEKRYRAEHLVNDRLRAKLATSD